MKSYTDLEQSKKLAKILPLESADMIYMPMMDIDSMSNSVFFDIPECYSFNEFKDSDTKPLPCWSLAALLSILPKSARLEKGKVTELYRISLPVELEASDWYINPVDACVTMIDKLHKQNLI